MKIFRFRGGIHPEGNRIPPPAIRSPACRCPAPAHPAAAAHRRPAAPEVKVGDRVLGGQRLARHQGSVVGAGARAHLGHGDRDRRPWRRTLRACRCRRSRSSPTARALDRDRAGGRPFSLSRAEVAARVRDAGIVGLGGAAFPAAVKLDAGNRHPIDTLIINGGECGALT